MDSNNKWAESLGISPAQIQAWCRDNKPNQPVPFHLMLNKHIDEEAYLHWARQEFGLASVGRSYFVSNHDAELWYAMKIEHHWSPWFLPLKIWDNTLFVGCVQPPTTPLNISLPVHYVLCPAAGLERLWKFYMGDMGVEVTHKTNFTVTTQKHEPAVEQTSAKIPMDVPEPTVAVQMPAHVSEPAFVIPTPAAAAPVQEVKKEALSSLNFGNITAESGRLSARPAKAHESTAASTQASNSSGFSFDFSNLSLNKPDGEAKAKTKSAPAPAPAVAAAPAPTPQVPPTIPTPTFSGTVARFELSRPENAPAQPPAPPKMAPPPPPTLKPAATAPAMSATNLKVATAPKVSGVGTPINLSSYAFPPSMEMAKNFEQVIAYAFKEMATKYEKCLFAAYDGPKLMVAHWTANCTPDTNGATLPLVIDRPNMFKIAHDTKKPFHGPVAMNDVNKTFFTTWNNSQIPTLVTIFPLVAGQTLLGHLIGISNKEVDLYSSLDLVSTCATQICNKSTMLAA